MAQKMEFKFTLFCRQHEDDSYTLRVLEIPELAAHGVLKERCEDDLKVALKDLAKSVNPDYFEDVKQIPNGRYDKIRFQIQPLGVSGRRKRTKVSGEISLVIYPYKKQFLVVVPATKPQLRFLVDSEENINSVLKQELDNFFHDYSIEEIMNSSVKAKEWLSFINIKLDVRSPQDVLKSYDKKKNKAITEVAENAISSFKNKNHERAFGVKEQVNEVFDVLSDTARRSVLIIGKTMSGKSAVINEVAYLISKKRCPDKLINREIWKTSPERLDSHAYYIEMLLQIIIDYSREENCIIWFDDLATVMNSQSSFIKGDIIVRIISESVRKGEIVIIGEITPQDYENLLSSNSAFLSLFHQIHMPDYDKNRTEDILKQVRKRLELNNNIHINPDVINVIIELTYRFLPYWNFPGKAINLLKEIILQSSNSASRDEIEKKDVYSTFAKQTGLPVNLISDYPPLNLEEVKNFFSSRILGQDAVIEKVIDLICLIKTGMNDPQKPLGNFIFLGPTGVGKTYLAKSLAEYLFGNENRMIRLDMSEYSGGDALYKLLGVVGGESGILTKQIVKQPFSLLLFDEIEKADQSVFDILLQIMGEGRITGADGKTVDFRSAIIILTSNLGASRKEMQSIGFGNSSLDAENYYLNEMEKYFRPEFVNRIDYIVPFNHLSESSIQIIAEHEIQKAISRYGINKKKITLEVENEISQLIIERGFSEIYGARPIKRAIESILINPLARYISSYKESELQHLRLFLNEGKIDISNLSVKKSRVKISESDPLEKKYTSVELPDLQRKAGDIRLRSDQMLNSDSFEELQTKLRKLILESREEDFYTRPEEEIKEIRNNIYDLGNMAEKIRKLNDDVHYLEDLTDIVIKQNDLDYVAHISRKYNYLNDNLSFLEIEFANWNHFKGKTLLIARKLNQHRVFKGENDWLKLVTKMYVKWLESRKYSYNLWELSLPAKKTKYKNFKPEFKAVNFVNPQELIKHIAEIDALSMVAFEINDSFVYGFLKGEKGVHKLDVPLPDEEDVKHNQRLVKVDCRILENDINTELQEIIDKAVKTKDANSEKFSWQNVFDMYISGGEEETRVIKSKNNRILVEDFSSSLQTKAWQSVLDGKIDCFILKRMRDNMHKVEE